MDRSLIPGPGTTTNTWKVFWGDFSKWGGIFRGAMKWVIERRKDGRKEGREQLNCEATIWKTNGICLASVRRAIIHRKKPGLVKRWAVARASAGGFLQWNREHISYWYFSLSFFRLTILLFQHQRWNVRGATRKIDTKTEIEQGCVPFSEVPGLGLTSVHDTDG